MIRHDLMFFTAAFWVLTLVGIRAGLNMELRDTLSAHDIKASRIWFWFSRQTGPRRADAIREL